jgi:hypothetical protein
MSNELNIYQRINKIMQEVKYVQKDSDVSGMGGGYKAVSHDQVVSVIRESLVKNGIVVIPEQIRGEFLQMRDVNAQPQPIKMGLYCGDYKFRFTNIDKPEEVFTCIIQAHANDNGDKAPGKALSYATKSALLKVFCLETGENDESREEQRDFNLISPEQIDQLYKLLCDEKGMYTEHGLKVSKAFKFTNLGDIKAKKFNEILRFAS